MSKTVNDLRAAIEKIIADEMAISPAYPVAYQNVPFVPPNNAPWLQVFVLFGDSNYQTLVKGFNRQNGIVAVNVFTPVGVGTAANYQIANRISNLFNRLTISSLVFSAPNGPRQVSPTVIPESTGAAATVLAASYFQTQLAIPFQGYLD